MYDWSVLYLNCIVIGRALSSLNQSDASVLLSCPHRSFAHFDMTPFNETVSNVSTFRCHEIAPCQAKKYVWGILAPIILFGGSVGNIAIILVFLCPQQVRRKPVLSLTLGLLAVFDIMALLTGLVRHWLRKSFYSSMDVQNTNGVVCKLHEFFVYFSLTMATWTLVVISFERFTIVWFRVRARRLLTVRRTAVLFLVLGFMATAVHAHFFWSRGMVDDHDCSHVEHHKAFSMHIMPVVDATLSTGLPMALVVAINFCILYKLYLRKVENARLTSQIYRAKYSKVMGSTTKMLLIVILLFIICVLPAKIYIAVMPCKAPAVICENKGKDPTTYEWFRLLWTIVLHLQFTNHSLNFYVYLCTSSSFRKDLMRTTVFWVCRRCCSERYRAILDSDRNTDESRRPSNVLSCTINLRTTTSDSYVNRSRGSYFMIYHRSPSPCLGRAQV